MNLLIRNVYITKTKLLYKHQYLRSRQCPILTFIPPRSSHSPPGPHLFDSDDEDRLQRRMNRPNVEKRTERLEKMVRDWVTFLDKKGYEDTDDYVLSEYRQETRVKLLILFIISLEEAGVNPKSHIAAIRTHFQRHFGNQELFSDWSLALVRKQVDTGRQLSIKMEDRLRIPTPFVFMGYMRKAFFLAGVEENNVSLMLVYLGNVLCYDRCMRASEVAMCNSKVTHAIRVMDTFIEYQKEDGTVGRWMPWDLTSKPMLICCTTAEAREARSVGRGAAQYFALKSGSASVRGVYPSRTSVMAAASGQFQPVWRVFTNRAKAYAFSDEDSAVNPDKDTSCVVALHLLNRSAKARKNGTIRRIVYRVSPRRADGTLDAESQIVLDLLQFFKLAGFSASDGELPMLSRWGEGLQLKRLTRDMMAQGLKDAACHFDLDPRFFATHSNRISHASTLMNAGFAEDDIQKFCDWAGESSRRYEVAFNARPSAMRLAEEGAAMPLADARSMVPPRFWREPRPDLVLRLNLREMSAVPSAEVFPNSQQQDSYTEAVSDNPTPRPNPHKRGVAHANVHQLPTLVATHHLVTRPEDAGQTPTSDISDGASVTSSGEQSTTSSSSRRMKKVKAKKGSPAPRPPVDDSIENSDIPIEVAKHKVPMYVQHRRVNSEGKVVCELEEDFGPVLPGDLFTELELDIGEGKKITINVRPVGWGR